MDPIQLTIIIISFVLTTLLVVIGIQVMHIFKEMRTTLIKINSMLDDTKKVTETVSHSVTALNGVASGMRTALSFFNRYKKSKEREE